MRPETESGSAAGTPKHVEDKGGGATEAAVTVPKDGELHNVRHDYKRGNSENNDVVHATSGLGALPEASARIEEKPDTPQEQFQSPGDGEERVNDQEKENPEKSSKSHNFSEAFNLKHLIYFENASQNSHG